MLLIGPLKKNLSAKLIQDITMVIHENEFENVASRMVAILNRPQWYKVSAD